MLWFWYLFFTLSIKTVHAYHVIWLLVSIVEMIIEINFSSFLIQLSVLLMGIRQTITTTIMTTFALLWAFFRGYSFYNFTSPFPNHRTFHIGMHLILNEWVKSQSITHTHIHTHNRDTYRFSWFPEFRRLKWVCQTIKSYFAQHFNWRPFRNITETLWLFWYLSPCRSSESKL